MGLISVCLAGEWSDRRPAIWDLDQKCLHLTLMTESPLKSGRSETSPYHYVHHSTINGFGGSTTLLMILVLATKATMQLASYPVLATKATLVFLCNSSLIPTYCSATL